VVNTYLSIAFMELAIKSDVRSNFNVYVLIASSYLFSILKRVILCYTVFLFIYWSFKAHSIGYTVLTR